jgi:hypothetical protein
MHLPCTDHASHLLVAKSNWISCLVLRPSTHSRFIYCMWHSLSYSTLSEEIIGRVLTVPSSNLT